MATFEYDEHEFGYIRMKAERGEEIPVEMAQTFALLQIGPSLNTMARAIYELSEQVARLDSIEVDLKK